MTKEVRWLRKVKSKIEALENQIRRVKGVAIGKSVRFSNLCLHPDLEYPPNLRVPKLEKYGCPWTHLHLYGLQCLSTPKLTSFSSKPFWTAWHVMLQLDLSILIKWKLVHGKTLSMPSYQYKFNFEVFPDWYDLNIKLEENFRDYAQCWHAKADQVEHPLWENESWSLYSYPLRNHRYEYLIVVAPTYFTSFIQAGQKVEDGIQAGLKNCLSRQTPSNNRAKSSKKAWGRDKLRCHTECQHYWVS